MSIYELSRDQIAELKANYLVELANEGAFSEALGTDYGEPTQGDLMEADRIVPDEVVFGVFAGTEFSEEDFSC